MPCYLWPNLYVSTIEERSISGGGVNVGASSGAARIFVSEIWQTRGLSGFFAIAFAAYQRGKDANRRDSSADQEGCVETAGKDLLQMSGLWSGRICDQEQSCRRAAQARENSARQRDTKTLTQSTPGCQKARSAPSMFARGRAQ